MKFDPGKLADRAIAFLPMGRTITEIFLAALLGVAIARLVAFLLFPQSTVSATVVEIPASVAATTSAPVRADIRLLTLGNPFGAVEARSATSAIELEAPETDLNLILRGARSSSGENAVGTAYIVTPDNRLGAYREGQEILPGQVTLERVLSDRVILNRNGTRESLKLNDDAGPDGLSVIRDPSAVQTIGGRQDVVPGSEPLRSGSEGSVQGESASGRIRNPAALISAVSLTPEVRDGRRIGLRVVGGAPAETGLQSGDVLTSVNGLRLADAGLDEVVETLAGATALNVRLIRNGQDTAIRIAVGE